MNFFERQHAARNASTRLVVLFALAVISIVVVIDVITWVVIAVKLPRGSAIGWLVFATVATLLIIGGGTAFKLFSLRGGGAVVARSLGAVPVDPSSSDPRLRRFVNVVEEMAIASGVPVPRLFVLEQEQSINAFAAGYTPADAAITVTAGALAQLNRDELQGVIGHEFSHVLNGDMRLNVRLIGLLSGILLLGLIGLRIFAFGGGRGSRDKGAGPLLIIALVMTVLGFVGQFFAKLIKAGVSRQREWLADASAVQFTRQTTGLEGALKKIAGVPTGSVLRNAGGAREVSHMLFGDGEKFASRLFATHPPLDQRIAALDPSFRPDAIAALRQQYSGTPPDGLAEDVQLGFAPAPPPSVPPSVPPPSAPAPSAPAPRRSVQLAPEEAVARVATPGPPDLDRAVALSARIPVQVRTLAQQATTAVPLVLALALSDTAAVRDQQLAAVAQHLGPGVARAVDGIQPSLRELDALLRLPVAGIAAPLIVARPPEQVAALQRALDAVALADARVTVFEYCLLRLIACYLRDAQDPRIRSRRGTAPVQAAQSAAFTLLAVVAAAGNADAAAAERAFHAATARLLPGASPVPYAPPADIRALDPGWDVLDALAPTVKQALVEAVVVAVRDDGVLTTAEAELLRTTCAVLHCPLPALVA